MVEHEISSDLGLIQVSAMLLFNNELSRKLRSIILCLLICLVLFLRCWFCVLFNFSGVRLMLKDMAGTASGIFISLV